MCNLYQTDDIKRTVADKGRIAAKFGGACEDLLPLLGIAEKSDRLFGV